MLFIQYPPCTTCQKAKKWLEERGVVYTDRHIKIENPSYEELKAWHEKSGLPLKKFFNTSGLVYKSLNLKEKLPTMTEEEQLRLLSSDGMLVKRPILVTEDTVLVGFKAAEWAKYLPTGSAPMKIHGYKRERTSPLFCMKKHNCPVCGRVLEKVEVSQVVNSGSEEAKNFDFSSGDVYMVGNIKFIWDEFHCAYCNKNFKIRELKELNKMR